VCTVVKGSDKDFLAYCADGTYIDCVSDTIQAVTVEGKGGRPRVGKRRDIRLSDEHWQMLKAYGNDEAAAGLRRLIEENRRKLTAALRDATSG
jgi:hypothetical protein